MYESSVLELEEQLSRQPGTPVLALCHRLEEFQVQGVRRGAWGVGHLRARASHVTWSQELAPRSEWSLYTHSHPH